MATNAFEFSEDWTGVPVYCGMDVHKHVLAVTVYARDDSRTEFVKTAVFGTDSGALQMFWGFVSVSRFSGSLSVHREHCKRAG